jgi:hypothetical protein
MGCVFGTRNLKRLTTSQSTLTESPMFARCLLHFFCLADASAVLAGGGHRGGVHAQLPAVWVGAAM